MNKIYIIRGTAIARERTVWDVAAYASQESANKALSKLQQIKKEILIRKGIYDTLPILTATDWDIINKELKQADPEYPGIDYGIPNYFIEEIQLKEELE